MEILARGAAAAALTWNDASDSLHGGHGLFLTVADAVHGAPLPSLDHTWLALAPFEKRSLPADKHARDATLRQRMKLLEVLVRLSMTRRYDWQTRFTDTKGDGFSWAHALQNLQDTTTVGRTHHLTFPQAAHTLRWGHPRLLVSLVDDPVSEQYPEMLEQFLSAVTNDNANEWRQDAAFRALLDEDEQRLAAAELRVGSDPTTRHRIVELCIAVYRGQITTSLLHRILDVLERFHEAQQARHDDAMARGAAVSIEFRVTAVRFAILCDMTSHAIAQLGERARDLRFVNKTTINLPWQVEARSFQQCLTTIAGSRDAARAACETLPHSLSVKNAVLSFASLGATMRYPAAVHELDATYAANDMAAFAAWLAFGLFHADSASQVSTLRVRMPGTPATVENNPPYALSSPAWIAVFKRVLTSVAASQDLAPITVSTSSKNGKRKHAGADAAETDSPVDDVDLPHDRRVVVTVRAKTKVFAQPSPRSELVAVLGTTYQDVGSEVTRFQVVRRLRAWLALAIPGAGAGWIRTDAVVSEDSIPTKVRLPSADTVTPPHRVDARVTSFAWIGGAYPADDELRAPHADALMELLAIIGEPLEELHLPWMALRNRHIAPILRFCPNLRELNVANNEITDIAPLVVAFQTGACQITSLNVGQYGEVNERILQQTAKIVELGSSTLQRLVVRITRVDSPAVVRPLRDALLPSNSAAYPSQLEYVRVHCDDLDERDDYEQLEGDEQPTSAQVHALFQDVLATATHCNRPLPVRSKAAMLSVWTHETQEARALSSLDRSVLSTIFELARTSHDRTVEIWDQ